jgi:hypothetical protein
MDDLLAVEGVDVFFVGPRVYLGMACGTPCRLAHFRLTTLNPNLFGSPTRSDYCFLARSDRDAEWQRRGIFGIRNLNSVRRCAEHLGRGINLSEAE